MGSWALAALYLLPLGWLSNLIGAFLPAGSDVYSSAGFILSIVGMVLIVVGCGIIFMTMVLALALDLVIAQQRVHQRARAAVPTQEQQFPSLVRLIWDLFPSASRPMRTQTALVNRARCTNFYAWSLSFCTRWSFSPSTTR